MLQKINSRRFRRGQSTLEYAVLIVIVIGALIAIQYYIKRGLQGRFKSATDDIGDQFSAGNMAANRVTTTSAVSNETFIGGVTRSATIGEEKTTTEINAHVYNRDYEYWATPEE